MFWLVYYNGVDRPIAEEAFLYPWCLCDYVKGYFTNKVCPYYVFTPEGKVVPLKKFYDNYHKEK